MDKKEFDKIVKACRFCLMCRHMCTVGNITYVETNTPRGQTLMLDCMDSEALENTTENRKRAAEVLFECCYCGHCQNNCVSSYRHPDTIIAARANVAEADLPENVKALRAIVEKTGEIYKAPKQISGNADVKNADVLIYFGSFIRNEMQALAKTVMDVLEKAGVSYTFLSEERDTGMDAYYLGMSKKAQQQMDGEIEKINALQPKTIVVMDPQDMRAFMGDVPDIDAKALKATVTSFAAYAKKLADEKKITLKKAGKEGVAYHDGDQSGRFLQEFAQPREIIDAVPGINHVDIFWKEGDAASAGESGMIAVLNPKLAARIAEKRWEQIDGRGVDVVVTDSPRIKAQLTNGRKNKVLHIAEFIENYI